MQVQATDRRGGDDLRCRNRLLGHTCRHHLAQAGRSHHINRHSKQGKTLKQTWSLTQLTITNQLYNALTLTNMELLKRQMRYYIVRTVDYSGQADLLQLKWITEPLSNG